MLSCVRSATPSALKTIWGLTKIMVGVSFAIMLLQYFGVIAWISELLTPVFSSFGLPGEAALAYVSGYFVNCYTAMAVMSTLELSMREATILAVMVLCSHNMIVETTVQAKTGSSEQTRRAIPRMKRLGTKMVRIMSWKVLEGRPPEDQMRELRWERLRTLVGMFLDAGLQPLHENCMNYAGRGWSYTLDMLDRVPGLKLVFDTGNPVMLPDWTKPEPWPRQSSWEFYDAVKDHVAYVHIKDGNWIDGKMHYTYPGEGQGDVKRIVADLVRRGYDGGISMEPHLAAIFHDPVTGRPDPVKMHDTYVEYGRRFEKLLAEAKAQA